MELQRPWIGFTLGDPNSIGPEIILKLISEQDILKLCTPVIYGSSKVLNYYKKILKLEEAHFVHARDIQSVVHRKVNVIHCWEEEVFLEPGKVTEAAGKAAFLSLRRGVEDLKSGHIEALVTNPINKHNMPTQGMHFVGHTEYLQQEFKTSEVLMFMVSEELRIGVVTMHIPIGKVEQHISKKIVEQKLDAMLHSLKVDFGIQSPKVAILGLNPHAGDNGVIGTLDKEVLVPLIAERREKSQWVAGPFPADGFFGNKLHAKFDAVLAMYHDQGLIPFKMLAFEEGVNFTAGLPVVRTSPAHGTAYDIAGKGIASDTSLKHALYTALDIVKNRQGKLASVSVNTI